MPERVNVVFAMQEQGSSVVSGILGPISRSSAAGASVAGTNARWWTLPFSRAGLVVLERDVFEA